MKNTRRKAVLYYLYGNKNAGDAAIGMGALTLLSRLKFDVVGVSRWPEGYHEYDEDREYYKNYFPDLDFRPGPFMFRRTKGMLNIFRSYFSAFISLFVGKGAKRVVETVLDCDIVLLNGGNLIRCQSFTDFIRLGAFLYPLLVASKRNVPFFILPQSTVKLHFLAQLLVGHVFRRANVVWIREDISLSKFSSMFPDISFSYAPDMAFHIRTAGAMPIDERKNEAYTLSRPRNIAITLRDHTIGDIAPLSVKKRLEILHFFEKLAFRMAQMQACKITLVVQSDKDELISKELFAILERQLAGYGSMVEVFDTRDTCRLIQTFQAQDLLIGMRLHSIILALSAGTPCIGYFDRNWGLKNPGMLNHFRQPVFFLGGENSEAQNEVAHIFEERDLVSAKLSSIVTREVEIFETQFEKQFALLHRVSTSA